MMTFTCFHSQFVART